MAAGFVFPFSVTADGTIAPDSDEDVDLRGRILQVLLTTPGERVNLPEFGCGLFNLVFDPNDPILGAATEFTVGQALTRWLGDEIWVSGVNLESRDETLTVEIAYIKRANMTRQAVRVHFR